MHSVTLTELNALTTLNSRSVTMRATSPPAHPAVRSTRRRCFGKCAASSRDTASMPLITPRSKLPALKSRFHLPADFFPAGGADPGVDAAVGDDLDVTVGQQQIDQDAVVVGGVPDPQLRKDIQRALPRRLIAKQRCAVERAFDHETDLPGMRGLARLDRLLDSGQHLPAERSAAAASGVRGDACRCARCPCYQLPDAPPPPKLPPPPLKPPLSLELPLLPPHSSRRCRLTSRRCRRRCRREGSRSMNANTRTGDHADDQRRHERCRPRTRPSTPTMPPVAAEPTSRPSRPPQRAAEQWTRRRGRTD